MQRATIWITGLVALAAVATFCAYPKARTPRVVRPVTASAAPLAPAQVTVTWVDGRLKLTGRVSTEAERLALADGARMVVPGDQVDDRVDVVAATAAAPWTEGSVRWLAELRGLRNGKIEIGDGRAAVDGEVVSDDARTERAAAFSAALGKAIAFDDRLRVLPSPTAALVAQLNQTIGERVVEFATGNAILTPRGRALLDELVAPIQREPTAHFAIDGHTDNTGDPQFNRWLSTERAGAVRNHFVAAGVSATRLTARGFGPDRPVADNATAAGRARNRRVEFALDAGK